MHERAADGEHGSGPVSTAADGPPSHLRGEIAATAAVCVGVLLALTVIAIFRVASVPLTALMVGVVAALALDPVLRAVQRKLGCSRAVGTLVLGTLLAAALAAIVLVLGPQAIDQAEQFAEELPATVEDLYSWPIVGPRLEDADAVGRVERFVGELPEKVDADAIADVGSRLFGGLASALLVLLSTVAVLLDGEALVARVRRWVRPSHRDRADAVGRVVYRSIARYFAGSVAVAVLNGLVILTVGLLLGVPLAPLAGVWAAITNLIPQVGGFLGGSFFVLLAVTQGPVHGLIALAVFLGYQQLENNVIQPTVVGRAVDLSPPTTMLAALIGGAAAGVPGALVATPIIGAVKSVWLDTRGADRSGDRDDEEDQADDEVDRADEQVDDG